MKNSIKMVAVLVAVGLFSGGLLVCVYNYTSPLIADNKAKELKAAIFLVLPDAQEYNEIEKGGIAVYEGIGQDGRVVGYAFDAAGFGYQGQIRIMAGIDPSLETLKGIEVLESSETPGLGAEITRTPFKDQFKGLETLPKISYTKESVSGRNEVEVITGATISTKSVVEILNKRIIEIRKAFGK